jgi:hypothetical protein
MQVNTREFSDKSKGSLTIIKRELAIAHSVGKTGSWTIAFAEGDG